jgi:hypothetical protein
MYPYVRCLCLFLVSKNPPFLELGRGFPLHLSTCMLFPTYFIGFYIGYSGEGGGGPRLFLVTFTLYLISVQIMGWEVFGAVHVTTQCYHFFYRLKKWGGDSPPPPVPKGLWCNHFFLVYDTSHFSTGGHFYLRVTCRKMTPGSFFSKIRKLFYSYSM